MILNDLFLEINQVFTRAYCARDGARPCRLRPLPCDWLLPKRRDIIRLLGNKEKWLSSWIESPNKGIFRCRESVFFILQIVFFLIPFYQFFINPRIFTRPCTVPDDQVIRVTLAQSHMALRPGLWSNMVGHGKKNENYRCVHWFFEDQTFSILFPDNVCWMFDKNTLRSGNQPTFL